MKCSSCQQTIPIYVTCWIDFKHATITCESCMEKIDDFNKDRKHADYDRAMKGIS